MTVYEFPLSERVRTWLRLENLFDKALYFIHVEDARCLHAGLLAVFEIVDVTIRSELKAELIQELDRQRVALDALRTNPAVDHTMLEEVLKKIGDALAGLHSMTGKMGQHVRDNEWLAGIKGRVSIPGGTCSFDLPVYRFWLHQPTERCRADIMEWLAPLLPLKAAAEVVLRILRESGHVSQHTATQGQFQLMLGGRSAQLLRVMLDAPCAPEVGANKYAVNIRFLIPDTVQKPRPCDQDVPFGLAFCSM